MYSCLILFSKVIAILAIIILAILAKIAISCHITTASEKLILTLLQENLDKKTSALLKEPLENDKNGGQRCMKNPFKHLC